MAEQWQQWMPLDINEFRGSPSVQAMHPTARSGYFYLLMTQWQTEDCTLQNDPTELAIESGLGDEMWAQFGPAIVRKFAVLDSGRLRNEVCFEKWNKAKHVFESRRQAAQKTNSTRSPHGHRTVTARRADTRTGTGTGTVTETKTREGASAPPPPCEPTAPPEDEERNIPDDLPDGPMGNFLLERLSIPHSFPLSLKFASCVALLARDEQVPRGRAASLLLERARDHPPDSGKWRFWLEDGSWKHREPAGISTEGWD